MKLNLKYFSLSFIGCILISISAVQAHFTGTSQVDIHLIDPDSIVVIVDISSDELLSVTQDQFHVPKTAQEDQLYRERIAGYLKSHIKVDVDNHEPENYQIIRWKPDGKNADDGFLGDSLAYWKHRIVTFAGTLPSTRKKLDVSIQLFAESGIQAVSEVSLYWHDTLLTQQWLALDHNLRMPISQDSLAAATERIRHPAPGGSSKQKNLILRFIGLGYTHILPEGLDHILFVLGLFFFATRMRPLLWQITAFTIAHSVTLGLAMSGVFSLPSQIVEPLIALSIAVVAIENIFFRKVKASRWMIVFGFGLIHGMGFASALRDLGLPAGKFWPVLASFNVGVELGQLTVVTAAFLLTRWMWHKPWYFKRVVVPVSSVITVIALYWVAQRTIGL
jgi:hypothetical protein